MKIEKIEIKGLFGKKDICWKLNPQVNVLVGVNGSGKSTIINVIKGTLEQNINHKIGLLINTVSIYFNEGSKAFFEKKLFSEILNKDEIGKYIDKNPNLHQQYVSMFSSFGEIIDEFDNLNLYLDLIEANLTNSNANQNFTRSNNKEENVLDLEIRETIDELNKIANPELITRLSGSLNAFFNQIGKHVSYENNELVYTDTQLQQKLNYSHLSSGERQLIYILLRVALSNGDKSKTAIILMDEPEISLHLDWQEHFIKQLTILNPDAQFIIVTHSPALIMNGWNDIYVDMEEITTWQ